VWCSTADRCSDGMDRSRQEWLVKGCDKFFIDHTSNCSASLSPKEDDVKPVETTTTTSTRYHLIMILNEWHN